MPKLRTYSPAASGPASSKATALALTQPSAAATLGDDDAVTRREAAALRGPALAPSARQQDLPLTAVPFDQFEAAADPSDRPPILTTQDLPLQRVALDQLDEPPVQAVSTTVSTQDLPLVKMAFDQLDDGTSGLAFLDAASARKLDLIRHDLATFGADGGESLSALKRNGAELMDWYA